MITVEWTLGSSSGSGIAATVEDVVQVLIDSATETYGQASADVLFRAVGPIRTAVLTDGREALARGETWTTVSPGVRLMLCPASA